MEMFALTQFGTLQSKSHVALPPDPGSSAAAGSCFCPHIRWERVACLRARQDHAPRLYPHADVRQELLHHRVPAKGR